MSDGYAASGYPMPGFPDVRILIRKEAEPGIVVLARYEIPDRPTAHPAGGPIVGYRDGFPRRENPFALARGWLVRATGPQAEGERGVTGDGPSTADRVRAWYRRIPKGSKIDLRPPGYLPVDDPLLARTDRFERFVTDECILTLIVYASRGNPGIGLAPVRFAVQPEYHARIQVGGQRRVHTVRPIEELRQLFELYRRGHIQCPLADPRGMTLQEAAVGPVMVDGYRYPTLRYPSLTKSLSASPNDM